MRLEALAETVEDGPRWPVVWELNDGLWELDWAVWLDGLLDEHVGKAHRAWALHDALARALPALIERMALPQSLTQRQPANDGGLALGQLIEVAARGPLTPCRA
jgi:hydrogenase maturation factor HypF (carbamoyltransferase family)